MYPRNLRRFLQQDDTPEQRHFPKMARAPAVQLVLDMSDRVPAHQHGATRDEPVAVYVLHAGPEHPVVPHKVLERLRRSLRNAGRRPVQLPPALPEEPQHDGQVHRPTHGRPPGPSGGSPWSRPGGISWRSSPWSFRNQGSRTSPPGR